MGTVACWSKSLVLRLAIFGLCAASVLGQSTDWNLAVLDKILATVPPGQDRVQVGDMVFTVSFVRSWRNQLAGGPQIKLAFDGTTPLWTSGNVYYTFSNSVSAAHQKAFLDGMNEWATFANLTFIPRTTQSNYVTIVDSGTLQSGGDSAVGMIGGQQFIHIGSSSWNRATACHEFGHTLGLIHEHQRSDRDSFVTIFTNNIVPGLEGNFVKLTNSLNETAYDFLSVMHYSRNSLSISNSLDTIEPLPAFTQYLNIMGQQFDPVLSAADRTGMAIRYGPPATPVTNIVINTKDSGAGSLRAAMYYALDHPGTTITFNIPTSDSGFSNSVFNIRPTDRFLSLANAMTIDATTEPTNSNPIGPDILLDGALIVLPQTFANGFRFAGSNCTVHGFIIDNFNGSGVAIEGSNTAGNAVSGCDLISNATYGAFIDLGANSNTITNNVISGNAAQGVVIGGGLTRNNTVRDNNIGIDTTGSNIVPNGQDGILLYDAASSNTVADNLISGNLACGITMLDTGTVANVVQNNFIGVNAAGTTNVANILAGIQVRGGARSNAVLNNLVSGNGAQGIITSEPGTDFNLVQGNYMGVNATGTAAIPNGFAGMQIHGGARSTFVVNNLISGNGNQGIVVTDPGSDFNVIQGNIVGLNAAGNAAIPNTFDGVGIFGSAKSNLVGGTTIAARNVISGNVLRGVGILGTGTEGNLVQGNFIGVDVTGTAAIPNNFYGVVIGSGAKANTLGGAMPGAGNVIAGHGNYNVIIVDPGTTANLIQGNLVGLNAAGAAAISNTTFAGVAIGNGAASNTIGGGVGARNVISGHATYGIFVGDTNTVANVVQGNTVGLDITGTTTIPNGFAGIVLQNAARSNQVGGATLGAANLVASNSSYGVLLFDAATTNNQVLGNSIFGNSSGGIVLSGGANKSRPAPSLSSAVLGTNTTIAGSLTSSSNATFRVEFFANPTGLGSQGRTFLGAINVTTSNGGTVNFWAGLASTVPVGQLITATATDPAGNTSQFSSSVTVSTTDSVGDGIPNAWSATFFGGAGNTTNNQSCAACDSDGDGSTTYQEFRPGTDPTKSSSALRVSAVQQVGNSSVVSFATVAGKTYRVETKAELSLAAWSLLIDQIGGTGGIIQIVDPAAATLPKRFYRVSILP